MSAEGEPKIPDRLAKIRRDLGTTITHILGFTEILQEQAEELSQETFLPDLQKIQGAGKNLAELIHELVGPNVTDLEEVDFARLRFEIRSTLNHTVGYIEMLQERAYELDQRGFLPDLEKVHAACAQLLSQMEMTVRPATIAPDAASGLSTEPGLGATAGAAVRTDGSLLVVDDNPQNRELLGRLLRRQGYRVVQAGSGPSAMERLRAEPFDLVLLDVVMPGMNGYEVVQWLKADSRLRHIPVLMIAAMNETENVVRCLVIGADDYVAKPFDPILLKARIGACLDRSRWRQQEQAFRRQIEEEQNRVETHYRTAFPRSMMDRVRQGQKAIADDLSEVTVLFAELLSTHAVAPPEIETMRFLHNVFSAFDVLAEKWQVEKIKTVGHTYIAAGGIHPTTPQHATAVAGLALAMQQEVAALRTATQRPIHLRVGIHTGPVVAGLIGRRQPSYELWGETMHTARRMEVHGAPDRIQISAATQARLGDPYRFEERCGVVFDGHGPMSTYYLFVNDL